MYKCPFIGHLCDSTEHFRTFSWFKGEYSHSAKQRDNRLYSMFSQIFYSYVQACCFIIVLQIWELLSTLPSLFLGCVHFLLSKLQKHILTHRRSRYRDSVSEKTQLQCKRENCKTVLLSTKSHLEKKKDFIILTLSMNPNLLHRQQIQ